MTLKRIELHGFKSFAKKSTLVFDAPVTAVVGPNGSGKSNVVEAIRFVLGEQSSKSLRSKTGADLIFKGSRMIPKMNRASVTIIFDNQQRLFQLPSLIGTLSLDFDEISITREVFTDGTNNYSINGSSVRLKDIHELISSVHIGSSGHHIISQGEADRLLNAKPIERKEILEEALGLRLYQYRINDASKKLEKTREHMREVELLRRELAPQVKFLKKQVDRVEQAGLMRNELSNLYKIYLLTEEGMVTTEMNRIQREIQTLEGQRKISFEKLQHLEKTDDTHILQFQQELTDLHIKKKQLELQDSEIVRSLGRIEGLFQAFERVVSHKPASKTIPLDQVMTIHHDALQTLQQAKQLFDLEEIKELIRQVENILTTLEKHFSDQDEIDMIDSHHDAEQQELIQQQQKLETQLTNLRLEITHLASEITTKEQSIVTAQTILRQSDQERFSEESILKDLEHRIQLVARDNETISARYATLDAEYRIAEGLLGDAVRGLQGTASFDPEVSIHEHESRKLTIDKLKIRLEDMGGGANDIIQEYQETVARDNYLAEQLYDLEQSITDLESIISDLKKTLTIEFSKGIETINEVFEKFFVTMFGGGSARLQSITILTKKKKTDENGEEFSVLEDDDTPQEQGIDIDINLPRKKVKDLEMLSGGERSLTSIALLFALSQVNPPPFLVLDETDAALDEANSKKYGDMIEALAKETQLIVVTHNRETMSRAGILYGVTLGADDASTLLSIKFDEAVKVAK